MRSAKSCRKITTVKDEPTTGRNIGKWGRSQDVGIGYIEAVLHLMKSISERGVGGKSGDP